MLHLYYTSLKTNKEKENFITKVSIRCKVKFPTVRSWIADPKASMHRSPKPVYRPIIAEIAGIPEEELFSEEPELIGA